MIPAGATMTNESFEIKINNDDLIEGTETFGLAINLSSLPYCISLADPNKTEVIIIDDDGKIKLVICHMYMSIFQPCIWLCIQIHNVLLELFESMHCYKVMGV